MKRRLAVMLGLAISTLGHGRAAEPGASGPSPVLFNKEVRPILAARCLGCHGGVTQKARLDSDAPWRTVWSSGCARKAGTESPLAEDLS